MIAAWTKERVEPGIYKRVSPTGEVAYFVQVRTSRGNASGTHRTITQARKWRAKVVEQMREGRYFGDVPGAKISVAKAVAAYLTGKGITRESDVTRYARAMFWADQFGKLPVLELHGDRVAEALDELGGRVSGATVNRYAVVLSSMWKWMSTSPRRWVRAEANPVREVERQPDSELREVTLSKDQRTALLKACSDNAELHAAVVIALLTGMRHGELSKLQWKDVIMHADHATATLRDTKNGEERPVAFVGPAFVALKSLPRGIGSAPVFSQRIADRNRLRSVWGGIVAKAELSGLRWHDLRHASAQLQLEGGSSLPEVALHLGHKSFAATRRYAALDVAHRTKLAERAGNVL